MKRLLSLFLLLAPVVSFAHELKPSIPVEKKFYIEPTQIGFSNNKIYVSFDGDWQSVYAIYADKKGIFIRPTYSPWECKQCGITNEFFRTQCKTEECKGKRPPKFSIPERPLPPLTQRPKNIPDAAANES